MFESEVVQIIVHSYMTVSLGISVFWIYIIITKSSPEMKQYRWALLKLAICDEMFVIFLGMILFPDPLFPAPCAAILGISGYFGHGGAVFAFCGTFFWGMSCFISINDCCHVRSMILHQKTEALRHIFTWWKGLLIISAIHGSISIPMIWAILHALEPPEEFYERIYKEDDLKYVEHYLRQNYTMISGNLAKNDYIPLALLVSFGLTAIYLANFASAAVVWIKLQRLRPHMSAKSFKSHKSMLLMLVCQNLYPTIAVMVPVVFAAFGFATRNKAILESKFFLVIGIAGLGFYPIISFGFSIVFVRPYKKYLYSLFRGKRANASSVIVSSQISVGIRTTSSVG